MRCISHVKRTGRRCRLTCVNTLATCHVHASLCTVCLESLAFCDEVCTMPCGHIFHTGCINKWSDSKSTCPLCRKNIFTLSIRNKGICI